MKYIKIMTATDEDLESDNIQLDELTDKDVKEFKKLLSRFIKSYTQKSDDVTCEEWLAGQFREEFPEKTDEEIEKLSIDTVTAISEYDANLVELDESCANGKSKESWFEEKSREAAAGMSVQDYGKYLQGISDSIELGNEYMLNTVLTNNYEISQAWNLDGFIAEQHHVNSFNNQVALENSIYEAATLKSTNNNSFDIVIKNIKTGKIVQQYQAKYGADAKATIQLLKRGNYNNQRILVPPEQIDEVQRAFPGKTVVSSIGGADGIKSQSKPLTKEQAREMRDVAQKEGRILKTDYNAFNTKELALHLGKNAAFSGMQAAAISTGFNLASKAFKGEKIEGDEVVALALKTGADAGIKSAVTGALHVGVEKGIIRIIPKSMPIGMLANIACVGIENIKIFGKVAIGELTISQGLDHMGRTTTAMWIGLSWGAQCTAIGAMMGTIIPIPVIGNIIGGVVGGMVGYMAGSKVGQTIYNGVKKVCEGAKRIAKTTWEKIKNAKQKIKEFMFG